MSTLLSDTFTGADGTAFTAHSMNVGSGWTAVTGAWTLSSNQGAPPANTSNTIATADAGAADGTLSALLVVPNNNNYIIGVAARTSDANNGWLAVVERDSGGTPYLGIYQRSSGTNTLRASTNATGATNSTPTITVTLTGSTIAAALSTGESTSYGSASANQTVTKHGVYAFTSGSYNTAPKVDTFLFATANSGGLLLQRRRKLAA